MADGISTVLIRYLMLCGLPAKTIALCDHNTRMYHDLGIYGDIADSCMEVLAEHFGVDLSGFEFEQFFPREFEGKSVLTRVLLWLVPFAGAVARRYGKWSPLTLARIDRAIRNKRWE